MALLIYDPLMRLSGALKMLDFQVNYIEYLRDLLKRCDSGR